MSRGRQDRGAVRQQALEQKEPGGLPLPWAWLALLLILALVTVFRGFLLEVPLERDEGEYAYAGQLLLQGIPPFAQAYNMKLPGIYVVYALIMGIFGQTVWGIHVGLLLANQATVLLLFFLGRRLEDAVTGVGAAGAFALLSISSSVQGVFANAEHFVLVPALGGLLLLLRTRDCPRRLTFFLSGLLLGSALVIKQQGGAFVILGGLYLLGLQLQRRPLAWRDWSWGAGLYALGAIVPGAGVCLWMAAAGVFHRFWFWTFTYAKEYVAAVPWSVGLTSLAKQLGEVISTPRLLWLLAVAGLVAVFTGNKAARPPALFLVLFLALSFAAVCPGFYFRPHYFVFLLPVVSLLAGIGLSSLRHLLVRHFSPALTWSALTLLLGVIVVTWFSGQRLYLLAKPAQASRLVYGLNPFPESLEVARYLREHSASGDRLAVLGSEPQIYFYAHRRSATKYIYTYALMEAQPYALQMQQEMIGDLEANHPKFVVFVNVGTSWLIRPDSPRLIFEWFQSYRERHLELIGVVDIVSADSTIYYWGPQAQEARPVSPVHLLVFRRKG